MNIITFQALIEREVKHFIDDWLQKNEEYPEDYPLQLEGLGDWLEQFEFWLAFKAK